MNRLQVYKYDPNGSRQYNYGVLPEDLKATLSERFGNHGYVQWFQDPDTPTIVSVVLVWVKDIGIYGNRFSWTRCNLDTETDNATYEQYFTEKVFDPSDDMMDILQDSILDQYSVQVDEQLNHIEYSVYVRNTEDNAEHINRISQHSLVELESGKDNDLLGFSVKHNLLTNSIKINTYYKGVI